MKTQELAREVKMLRSFAISLVGKDPEGEYRPEFVREVLRATNERPTRRFVNAKQFLAELDELDRKERGKKRRKLK